MTPNASRHSYHVEGMACDHCATAITEEVEGIAGVTRVTVDVESGVVTVTADGPLDPEDVRTAVDEAGYDLRERIRPALDEPAP